MQELWARDGVVNADIDATTNAATNNATRMESLRPVNQTDAAATSNQFAKV
jgi:hypothetical protein